MQCYETYGTRSIMFRLVWDMNTFHTVNACKTVISGCEINIWRRALSFLMANVCITLCVVYYLHAGYAARRQSFHSLRFFSRFWEFEDLLGIREFQICKKKF